MDTPLLVNLFLIVIILIVSAALLYLRFSGRRTEPVTNKENDMKKFNIEAIKQYVKDTLNEMTGSNLYDLGLSEEELRRRVNKRAELKRALKESSHGDIHNKAYGKKHHLRYVASFLWI